MILRTHSFVFIIISVPLVLLIACRVSPPDLPTAEASELISKAPEFNRYARLVEVGRIDHLKDSMDSVSQGSFTFRYINAPASAPPIKANADFRYWDGAWHLNQFDYGCPGVHINDCHIVHVYNQPPKSH